ncbi:hypothetical protein, partial [Neisseria sp.]|uniref:hypothetical protein n=1 Tax=Neisseria sp. TaxID=192066 RepID=UPI0035A16E2A
FSDGLIRLTALRTVTHLAGANHTYDATLKTAKSVGTVRRYAVTVRNVWNTHTFFRRPDPVNGFAYGYAPFGC